MGESWEHTGGGIHVNRRCCWGPFTHLSLLLYCTHLHHRVSKVQVPNNQIEFCLLISDMQYIHYFSFPTSHVFTFCFRSPSNSAPDPFSFFSYFHLFHFFFLSAFSYPDREQLQTIYSAYLQPVLQHSLGSQAAWASTGRTHQLAGSLVQLYEQVLNGTGCSFMFTFTFVAAYSCLWQLKHKQVTGDCD